MINKSKNELIPLIEVCRDLSISSATGKNWVKLGKLTPQKKIKQTPMFSVQYLTQLKDDIKNGKIKSLKSRRNKKYVSGCKLYSSYISKESKNVESIEKIINIIKKDNIKVTEELVTALIAECAKSLVKTRLNKKKNSKTQYSYLIDEINSKYNLDKYPSLLKVKYVYEQNEDILGLLYISLRNEGKRKSTGSYYTPTNIVKKLCSKLFNSEINNKKILDPCCGTGNFLLQLPDEVSLSNIYASDIDPLSVKITRINLALKYECSDKSILYNHVKELDYLNNKSRIKFDYIIGNPPWGYDYTKEEKSLLRKKYKSAVSSNIESYDIVIEKALSDLKKDGILSFVLPEAFLNVKTHAPIRKILMQNCSIKYLEYLGNVFNDVQCPSIILQILHDKEKFHTNGMTVNYKNKEFVINSNRITTSEYFSFTTTDEEYSILKKISDIPNKVTLSGNAKFAIGIVTGDNKNYISKMKFNNTEMVLTGSNIYKYKFKNSKKFIKFTPELFQQVAPEYIYRAKEKLFYRFICNQLVFAYDNSQTLSLNSCNILIPEIKNLDIKYIMAILNSKIALFFFKKQFNSVKILRSHIEKIPIPFVTKFEQNKIKKGVDKIINSNDKSAILSLYNELDVQIASLFNLTKSEYETVKNTVEKEYYTLFI